MEASESVPTWSLMTRTRAPSATSAERSRMIEPARHCAVIEHPTGDRDVARICRCALDLDVVEAQLEAAKVGVDCGLQRPPVLSHIEGGRVQRDLVCHLGLLDFQGGQIGAHSRPPSTLWPMRPGAL